jgi:hypothetical protein
VAEMAKKIDKKFLLLIIVIICTLGVGFFLTYLSTATTNVQNPLLRGVERNALERSSHNLADSDHEPHTTESITQGPSTEELDFVVRNYSYPMNESESSGVPNNSTNSSVYEEISPTKRKENSSSSFLIMSQPTFVNSSIFDQPYQTNESSVQPSIFITSAPTTQPSIPIDDLQDFLIPLKDGTSYLLSILSHSFWLQKAEGLIYTRPQTTESPSQLIAHFHSALKYGEICSDTTTKNSKIKLNKKVEIASKNLLNPSDLSPIHQAVLLEILSREINLFFEYHRLNLKFRHPVSFSVSSHFPNCLSILFDPSLGSQDQNSLGEKRICGAMRYPSNLNPPSNVILASPPTFNPLRKNQRGDQYDCLQLVNSFEDILPALNSETFPFEFEDALGSLLCRCNLTALPSELPPLSYFTYWESVDLLLEEAARSVESTCSFEVNHTEVKKFQRSEYLWIVRKDPERIQLLTPEIMFASYSFHPLSRSHVLSNMISPFEDQSVARALEKNEHSLPLETYLLTSDFFISKNRYQTSSRKDHSEQNKTQPQVKEESGSPSLKPTSSPVLDFSRKYSFRPLVSHNTSFRRKLSSPKSFFPGGLNSRLELSKKRPQVISPSRATFWIASHRDEIKSDEFDEWLEKDQSRRTKQPRDNDDDTE